MKQEDIKALNQITCLTSQWEYLKDIIPPSILDLLDDRDINLNTKIFYNPDNSLL